MSQFGKDRLQDYGPYTGSESIADSEHIMRLLESGAPLFEFPGPVLLVDRQKRVVGANAAAMALVHGIMTGTALSITALVSATLSGGGRPQTMKILDEEAGRTTDLTAISVDEGAYVLLLGRDISLDQNLRNALVESRQRYKDLVEISSDFAWETDANGKFVFVSTGGALGYEPDELVGHSADSFVDTVAGIEMRSPFDAREPVTGVEFRFRRADGSIADLEASAAPLRSDDGSWLGARGVCRDVTEERRRDAALAKARNRERLMAYIVRAVRDEVDPRAMLTSAARAIARTAAAEGCAICRVDVDGRLFLASKLGLPPAAFFDPYLAAPPSEQDVATVTEVDGLRVIAHPTRYRQKTNGAVVLWRDVVGEAWSEEDGDLMGEVANQIGIAIEQVASHEHLELLSTTDPLTKLLNRRTFLHRLDRRLAEKDVVGALAYIDLDNFKQVNDRLGHQMGDKVLTDVAAMMRAAAADGDMTARLGGDEFVLWFEGSTRADAERRATGLIADAAILEQYAVDPTRKVGMSIGIACVSGATGEDGERLIARADGAMYVIKRGGKNAYTVAPDYEPDSGSSGEH